MSQEFEVILPKLGESILNATIIKWFKKEGEAVKKDESLLEVATDKVNSEIPSPIAGVVKKIYAHPDQELAVGDKLCLISQGGATIETRGEMIGTKIEEEEEGPNQKDYYSPAVLRLARELKIPFETLEKMSGSGSGGRVTKKDVEDFAKRKETCPHALPSGEGIEHVKMSGLRKAIAQNITQSFNEVPSATLIQEIDVTDILAIIQKEKEPFFKQRGAKLSITSFMARAIARALKEYPLLNATLQGDTIVVKRFINLGIAVSIEQGVIVPVIRDCHQLPLSAIAKKVQDLAQRARTNSLSPDDVKEGTITMTNFGMAGVKIGLPIIRYPEVAILGIGGICKEVKVLESGEFGVRQIMHITLTFDHRVIDGMYGCEFLNALKTHLEKDLTID